MFLATPQPQKVKRAQKVKENVMMAIQEKWEKSYFHMIGQENNFFQTSHPKHMPVSA